MRSGGVCVFSERPEVALELLSAGRALSAGGSLVSITPGGGAGGEAAAAEQLARGADETFLVEPVEGAQPSDVHVAALEQALDRTRPTVLLVGATAHGDEVAARLAQRLGIGCASDCRELALQDGRLLVERTCLGRFTERLLVETRPAIATVQPRRFAPAEPDAARRGQPRKLTVDVPESPARILETLHRERSDVAIDKADVVVAVGRGLRSKDDLTLIEELARVLGGVVGASRPLTDDLAWLPTGAKVGLSGLTVKPKLYLACGISGQIEHNVGMRESGVVIAINSDPAAPIIQQADYYVTGDLYEVVPALIRALTAPGGRRR